MSNDEFEPVKKWVMRCPMCNTRIEKDNPEMEWKCPEYGWPFQKGD